MCFPFNAARARLYLLKYNVIFFLNLLAILEYQMLKTFTSWHWQKRSKAFCNWSHEFNRPNQAQMFPWLQIIQLSQPIVFFLSPNILTSWSIAQVFEVFCISMLNTYEYICMYKQWDLDRVFFLGIKHVRLELHWFAKKKKEEKIKPFNHLWRKTNESVLYKLNSNYKRSQNAKFS